MLRVIDGLNFDVVKGEKLVLIGLLGLGKIMILCILMMLEDIFGGCIEVCGELFYYMFKGGVEVFVDEVYLYKMCCYIGMVFQYFNLFLYKLVLQNIIFVLVLIKGESCVVVEKCVCELLDMVGLVDKVDYMLSQFFGGQKQCVVIVCVLVLQLQIMLFDEVILVFDFELVEEVLEVMKCLVNEIDMIMLLVMYEMGFVYDFVDCVLFFDKGCIVEQGLFDQIFIVLKQDCMKFFLCKIVVVGQCV